MTDDLDTTVVETSGDETEAANDNAQEGETSADEGAEGETQEASGAEGDETEDGKEKPEPEPKKERDTALFKAALKEREKARAVAEKAQALRAEAETKVQEASALRKQLEAERTKLEAIKRDPFAFFEVFGVDPTDFARKLIEHGSTPPEERKRASELEELRQWKEQVEAERQAEKAKRETSVIESRVSTAKASFVTFVRANAADYPDIVDEDDSELQDIFWDLASQHYTNTQEAPPIEAVAAHMQMAAAEKRARKEARRNQLKSVGTKTSESQGQRSPSPPAKGSTRSPKTLTNGDSARSSHREMTDEESDAWAIEQLRLLG